MTTRHLSFRGWDENYQNYLSQYYNSEYGLSEKQAYTEAQRASLSRIDTNNYSSGRGGDIRIQSEVLEMSPGVVETLNASKDTGLPGNIEIQAQQVILTGGGNINAATHGATKIGQININSSKISLRDSSFITASSSNGTPSDIDINTQHLTLEGSWISSFNYDIGDAGMIYIRANDSIFMSNLSAIFALAYAGNGGRIKIETQKFIVFGNSWIDPGRNHRPKLLVLRGI